MSGGATTADLHRLVSKDIRPLVKKALRAGWRLERIGHARSAHGVKLVSADGGTEVPLPRQGGGLNRLANDARKVLRRHGIE